MRAGPKGFDQRINVYRAVNVIYIDTKHIFKNVRIHLSEKQEHKFHFCQ